MNIIISSKTIHEKALEAGKALVSAFFPLAAVKVMSESSGTSFGVIEIELISFEDPETLEFNTQIQVELINRIQVSWQGEEYRFDGQETEQDYRIELSKREIQSILRQPFPGKEPILHILLKHGLYKLLTSVTNKELPWGILTGIRPTKLIHKLTDMGIPQKLQAIALEHIYAIRKDKIKLLQAVTSVQEGYLKEIKAHPERVSLYISIPFCPSRCSYCSFPGYALGKKRVELEEYLEVLKQEVRAVGEMMAANGLIGDSLYLGGGTPSILSETELENLLEVCRSWLPLRAELELTVEAGRPDTLSEKKLTALERSGVNRLSINPQTMQEKTLRRIGRTHSVESVVDMFKVARQLGEWVINMDLILGLPGEGLEEVRSTLDQIEILRPDNLTVHALALKKGSKEIELKYEQASEHINNQAIDKTNVRTDDQSEKMQKLAEDKAKSWGLLPYYLYRQKRITGNLENIGYARPGAESRYNIAIMEERQSIIGLGAGAATKIVNPVNLTLNNLAHSSDWKIYLGNWTDIHAKRMLEFSKGK